MHICIINDHEREALQRKKLFNKIQIILIDNLLQLRSSEVN